jgi:hypothetical protein
MAITPARERVRKSRERKRRGVIPVQVEVSTLEIDFLRRRGYGARSGDPVSISEAVSSLVADLVLEATVVWQACGSVRVGSRNFT